MEDKLCRTLNHLLTASQTNNGSSVGNVCRYRKQLSIAITEKKIANVPNQVYTCRRDIITQFCAVPNLSTYSVTPVNTHMVDVPIKSPPYDRWPLSILVLLLLARAAEIGFGGVRCRGAG